VILIAGAFSTFFSSGLPPVLSSGFDAVCVQRSEQSSGHQTVLAVESASLMVIR